MPDVLGIPEVARLLDIEPGTVVKWRQRGIFPPPDISLAGHPGWGIWTIREWCDQTGRNSPEWEERRALWREYTRRRIERYAREHLLATESGMEREVRESREDAARQRAQPSEG